MTDEIFTEIETHAADAKARQVELFKDRPNFDKLINLFAARSQNLESVIIDFRDNRNLDNAVGIQLDNLGKLFQQSRSPSNLSDIKYRIQLKIAYLELARSGQIETLIGAYKIYTPAELVQLTEYYPATVIINAHVDDTNIENPVIITDSMDRVKSAGIELKCLASQINDAFIIGATSGETGNGFGDVANSNTGGELGRVIQETLEEYFEDLSGNLTNISIDELLRSIIITYADDGDVDHDFIKNYTNDYYTGGRTLVFVETDKTEPYTIGTTSGETGNGFGDVNDALIGGKLGAVI